MAVALKLKQVGLSKMVGSTLQPHNYKSNVYENEYPPQRNQDVTVAGIENLYSLTNQNSASSNIS